MPTSQRTAATHGPRWSAAVILATLLLALILAACGAPAAPPANGGDAEIVVASTTRITDAETRAALTAFDPVGGTLTFSSSTPFLSALEPGDVIVSDVAEAAPYGFLRTVVEVREEAGGVSLTTNEATLEDVIVEGSFEVNQAFTAADVGDVEELQPGVSARLSDAVGATRASLDDYLIALTFDRVLIEDDGATVAVSGGVGIDLDWTLVVDYGALRGLREFRFSIDVDQRSELTLDSSVTGSFSRTIDVVRIPLNTQTVFVGPVPVVFSYEVFITIGASGALTAELVVGAAQTTAASLGASYVEDRSPEEWRGIAEFDLVFALLSEPELSVSAQARASGGARAGMLVYGLAGPNVALDAFAEVAATIPGDPIWRLYGGIEASAGFTFDVPVFGRIVEYSADLAASRQMIRSADNTAPTLVLTPPSAPVLFNRSTTLSGTVSDLEDGGACCTVTWTSDIDGPLGTTTSASPSLGHVFDAVGPRTITATAVDSAGETTTAALDLDVVNPPPTASIAPPAGTVRAEVASQLVARGSDPYRISSGNPTGNVACNAIEWSVPGATTLSSSSGCAVDATFPAEGAYEVTVTVTGAEGQTTSAMRTLEVGPRPENVITIDTFAVDGAVCNVGDVKIVSTDGNEPFGLRAAASDEQDRTLNYAWYVSYDPLPADGEDDTRTFTLVGAVAETSHLVDFEIAGNTGSDVTFRLRVDDGQPGEDNEVFQECAFFYLIVAN